MAKTLHSAVETLERDKAQLQSRVHSLEQRLMGSQASEGEDWEAPPSGEERRIKHELCSGEDILVFVNLFSDAPAGVAALEQLREEKEFAEGQVRLSGRKEILTKVGF